MRTRSSSKLPKLQISFKEIAHFIFHFLLCCLYDSKYYHIACANTMELLIATEKKTTAIIRVKFLIKKQQFHYRISRIGFFTFAIRFNANKRSTFRLLSFSNFLTPKNKSFPTMLSIIVISALDRTKTPLQNVLTCMSSEIKKQKMLACSNEALIFSQSMPN